MRTTKVMHHHIPSCNSGHEELSTCSAWETVGFVVVDCGLEDGVWVIAVGPVELYWGAGYAGWVIAKCAVVFTDFDVGEFNAGFCAFGFRGVIAMGAGN
mmetsp:Transcript_19526/g.24604  ORF Transcript_19526/g.24604 Transcript_19526/m.24604 type:complete len:99 (-) Transcript_19526:300-596(-)